MMLAHRARHPSFWTPGRFPTERVEVDPTHPLARGLLYYALPGISGGRNLVSGGRPWEPLNDPAAVAGPRGLGFLKTTADSRFVSGVNPTDLQPQRATIFSFAQSNAGGNIGWVFARDMGSSPPPSLGLYHWRGSVNGLGFAVNGTTKDRDASDGNRSVSLDATTILAPYFLGLSFDNELNGGQADFYVDGHHVVSDAGYGDIDYSRTDIGWYIGAGKLGASDFRGWIYAAGLYNRPLSPAEHAWLAAEPYAMLRPVKRRTVYVVAGGEEPGGNVYTESIALEGAASLAASPTLTMMGAVTIAGSADAAAAARQDHRGAVSVAGDAGAAVTARATFAGGIAVEATASASAAARADLAASVALAGSAQLNVSPGAQLFSEAIALEGSAQLGATGALHLRGSVSLEGSAALASTGALRIGEAVAFAASLDASAAASLTMQEALAAAATAALAIAVESSADNVIVRTVSLSGQRHLVLTLEGRRGRTIRLRGSLSH